MTRPKASIASAPKRGSARDAAKTQRLILDAAATEFAAKGLTGARVDQIALMAGVNKQLLYWYFGNKEKLYTVVLEEAYERFRAREDHVDVSGPAQEALGRLIGQIFDSCSVLRDVVDLIADENRHQGRHVRASSRITAMHRRIIEVITDLLERGVREGAFREGVEPVRLFVSILGLSVIGISNGYTLSAIFGHDFSSPREAKKWRAHVVEFVLASINRTP